MDVYDCPVVNISESVFEHNGPVANTLKRVRFFSHSGGLSIGLNNISWYNDTYNDTSPSVTVQNCMFKSNSAFPSKNLTRSSSNLFREAVYTGRGGAFGLLLSEAITSIKAVVDNCTFWDNSALSFGGAVYILFGVRSKHTVTVSRCTFTGNSAHSGAGGLLAGFFGEGRDTAFSSLNVSNCRFEGNWAPQGGGASVSLAALGMLPYTILYVLRYITRYVFMCFF